MRPARLGVVKASFATMCAARGAVAGESCVLGTHDPGGTPRPSRAGSRGHDDGVATVFAAVAVAAVVAVLGVVVALGAAVASRHAAEVAADQAALAGAAEGVRGRDAGCARARDVAEANGARVLACTWRGWSVAVIVTRPCDCPLRGTDDPIARARAGPLRGR